jgi:hypothetical protein
MLRIGEVAKKLGIPDEALSPYGHYKAKVSLDYIATLKGKKDGKLILVTAISPTPLVRARPHHGGPGRRAQPHRQEGDHLPARALARARVRHEGRRGAAAATRRWSRWRTSTSTSPATSAPSSSPTTCWPR